MSIQCKPVPNALTTHRTYSLRFVPRNTADEQNLAEDIHRSQPNFSPEVVETILQAEDEAILERLLNGEQVTKHGSFSWFISFTGTLENADEAPPPVGECLQVRVHASPPFEEAVRKAVQLIRLSRALKLPLINTVEDILLRLPNVLNPNSVLRISGENLYFDVVEGTGQCVLAGTESGEAVQSRINLVTNTSIMLMPDIPAQSNPWNNEYTLSRQAPR